MAHGVFHKELGEINLSELDLNHPADRRLWDSLYGKTVKGDLECLDCRKSDPGCPQWMFLRLWRGRPIAVHYSRDVRHPTAPESPRHKALKERIARAAEKAGYSAELEARAADGRRQTDVLVHGDDGLQLGCEIQLSYATAHSVAKRSDIARSDGLSPLWTTDDDSAPLIDRAPWARIDRMPEEILRNGNGLLVRGGVKKLKMLLCDERNPLPCPDRGYGRCHQWHGTWAPARGLHLDQLIAFTAAGEYVPLYLPVRPGRRRAAHLWVTPDDRAKYFDATGEDPTTPTSGAVDDAEPAPAENLPLSRECAYAQRLEDAKRRGSTPRDTGEIMHTGITLPAQKTAPASSPANLPPPGPTERRPETFLTHIHARRQNTPKIPAQPAPPHPRSSPPGTPPWLPSPPPASRPAVPTAPAPHTPERQPAAPPSTEMARPNVWSLAAELNCAVHQLGPCTSCRRTTRRYGDGGNPLCRSCRARRKAKGDSR